jgi:hypothetical protein
VGDRYDPYSHARELGLRIIERQLRAGRFSQLHLPSRVIVLTRGLAQMERRCCVAHEIVHFERGHRCGQAEALETRVHVTAAHRLVSSREVLRVLPWTQVVRELADEWWVDDETARLRVATLTEHERARLEGAA